MELIMSLFVCILTATLFNNNFNELITFIYKYKFLFI